MSEETRDNIGPLARDLLRRAARGLSLLPAVERARALEAIERFVRIPGPASYLAAVRMLGETAQALGWEERRQVAALRAQRRGLEALAAAPGMDPEIVAQLGARPADALAGARLEALGALITVRAELEARVAGEREALAYQLAQAKAGAEPPAPRPRNPIRRLRRVGSRGRP